MCLNTTTNKQRELKKCVRWSTVTVYEFDVAIGGSAVPRHGGPSVGLAKKPKCVWSSPLDCASDFEEGDTDRECAVRGGGDDHCPDEVEDGVHQSQVRAMAKIRERQRRRRRTRVRWLKPLERVTMLTQAGLSEKRIYRMMKECSAICMSRRINIQSP